ncbi:DUF3795 domain-containing protein [Sedimentibacter sp. LTW-03]|uniref:DUF3795 domain-containing protein n=1 Tax=Sedimentibacter sp. LTW-03 TaxID=3453406 RepID=UPI003F83BA84
MNENSIEYCGLVCSFCSIEGKCSCKSGNHCGKRLSPEGCYQYNCCTTKGINGCWECSDFPCGKDMLAKDKIKMRAFVRCIKEDGILKFISYLEQNQKDGIVYHRSGIIGDYDLSNEDEVIQLLRQTK